MMGHQIAQRGHIEVINLEEFVPQDHPLRAKSFVYGARKIIKSIQQNQLCIAFDR
jgi:hypothetical protein